MSEDNLYESRTVEIQMKKQVLEGRLAHPLRAEKMVRSPIQPTGPRMVFAHVSLPSNLKVGIAVSFT